MLINLNHYTKFDKYIRNGKECFLDKTKHLLRIATPEEEVRQRVIEFLNDVMQIPYTAIETEIPVSYFVEGQKGRMDIVVYGIKDSLRYPVLVIECKANDVQLTDEVYNQVKRYSEVIDIPVLMVTNGIEADILSWNYNKEQYEVVEYFPTYDELCEPEKLEKVELEEYSYKRYKYDELFVRENINREIELGDFVGRTCSKELIPHVVNLAESLLDISHKIEKMDLKHYKFLEDGGVRFTSFGNASGGSYPGLYRFFLVEDANKNVQIVSMSVCGCLNGRSLLVVAVDDLNEHHNSLQLSIEHFSVLEDKKLKFFHDGTLTVGNKGKAKKQEVLDYVASKSNLKVIDDNIYLGEIDVSDIVYVDSHDMIEFVGKLIEYALVRDEFRHSKK